MSGIKNRLNKLLRYRLTPLALVCALGLSAGAQAETLAEGTTPASDAARVPAAAKLRKDTVVAGISEPQGIFNPYLFTNGWDENVTDVDLQPPDRHGQPGQTGRALAQSGRSAR